jgi:hypothetical protein
MLAEMKEGFTRIFSTGASSPLDRLPEGRAVLRRLVDRKADNYAAQIAQSERYEEARQKAHRLKRQIEVMADPVRAREHGLQPLHVNDPRLQTERNRLEAIQADMREMQASLAARSEKLANLGRLIERLTKYAESLQGHQCAAAPAVNPRLPKNADPRQAVEQVRLEIARLQADLREIQAAPHPAALAKSRAREAVEALAERGRPDISGMIQHGEITPAWPSLSLRVGLSASVATAQASHPVVGLGHAEHVDALALVAWLHRDALIAKLQDEIATHADDAKALSDEERAAKVAEIRSAILIAEREEEAIIRLIERDGAEFERRVDADPRAILSIGSDAPAPTG